MIFFSLIVLRKATGRGRRSRPDGVFPPRRGRKPSKNANAFWNGRIRRVTHAVQQLEGKALNVCYTHLLVTQTVTQND